MSGLVLGATGQVGRCLGRTLGDARFLSRSELELTDLQQVRSVISGHRPAFIVNAAAYTAVDLAESQPELAMMINGHAAGEIAAVARELNVPLVHFSTDYVFSGTSPEPYSESDDTDPVNLYGRSKLLGEQLVVAARLESYWILRCSWVFSEFGTNFVKTMLRLCNSGMNPLRVVHDQRGRPTYAGHIATVVSQLLHRVDPVPSGIYHCASNGISSWYEFATEIVANAHDLGLLADEPVVEAIATSEYATAARRPANSVLSTNKLEHRLGANLPHWRDGLVQTLEALARD